jgi:hypothetical protein
MYQIISRYQRYANLVKNLVILSLQVSIDLQIFYTIKLPLVLVSWLSIWKGEEVTLYISLWQKISGKKYVYPTQICPNFLAKPKHNILVDVNK